MVSLFWPQFGALVKKNFIILAKHPFLNLLRCFILPVAYGVFLAVAQIFLSKPNNNGIGSPTPLFTLESQYDPRFAFVWTDATNGTSIPTASAIMSHITSKFSQQQLEGILEVATPEDIPKTCPQNFNFFSECFLALQFNSFENSFNYTIRGDAGLFHIDVVRHTSDFEKRVLPVQWAVDRAIIELTTGLTPPTPVEWPFTQATNEEQSLAIRLSYIRGLRTLLVLALFICYVGVAYHLPGNFSGERSTLLTSHLKAMGLSDSARITSWLFSISIMYLPAWIIVAIIWKYRIFNGTHVGLVLVVHVLLGLSLASWSLFVATPFGKSPSLAAVTTTLLAIVLAVLGLVLSNLGNGAAFIFSVLFPPSYYIFAIRAICGFENAQLTTNAVTGDPDNGLILITLIIAAVINVFLWPWLALLMERRIYDARNPSSRPWRSCLRRTKEIKTTPTLPPGVAISIEHLNKTYVTSQLGFKKKMVTAVSDLTLSIPKYGLRVLLGENGAGKSSTLSILAGLTGRSGGSVLFEGGVDKPERGTIGIVPQKNVLFPELSCLQTLQLWSVIKRSKYSLLDEDLEQLLRDCDLEKKIHSNSGTLSGGQKRKLQLAIGIVGGSPILLVDECTSGVDPLSRRSIWRTLASIRNERTILFTTHFLDEADLLADHISILAAPGTLVADGTPVSLKRQLGNGYSVHVSFNHPNSTEKPSNLVDFSELLHRIHAFAPRTYVAPSSNHQASYHLESNDAAVVQKVLFFIEENKEELAVSSYDVVGATIEDVFLSVMNKGSELPKNDSLDETRTLGYVAPPATPLALDDGKTMPFWSQALTIFHKRFLISRRSWLAPLLVILVSVAGSTIPLVFISGRAQTCVTVFRNATNVDLFLPTSPLRSAPFGPDSQRVLTSPPNIVVDTLGSTGQFLRVRPVNDNGTFVEIIQSDYRNLELGGVSFDASTLDTLVAWEATSPGLTGPSMLNLASNLIYGTALNTSSVVTPVPSTIRANYQPFPPINAGTLVALKWVAFFGAAMAVFPAFFALYVSHERRQLVQSMQMSNGLSNPIGLWLGHLLFDSIFSVIISTLLVIIFANASDQFHGLGFMWVVIVLYGISGALFAYCASLFTASPLAAFAAVAGYQIVMYILYLAGYLLTLTYAKTSDADWIITTLHFTLSICSPVASVMRAAFVSVNLFSLLCDGTVPITTASLGTITRYGGPILYLIIFSLFLLGVLVWVDSGSVLPRFKWGKSPATEYHHEKDVRDELQTASVSHDILRVLGVSKTFGSEKVVDDISLGVSRDTLFCLLGPNGAGKTSTFAIIRGDIIPDTGEVLVDGTSVIRHPRTARQSLGFCPQFTAIDSQLTVREHLMIYGRLKGLERGEQLRRNVESLMQATTLISYADRLASKLSGGNQRKLSLAIALIGNPPVILIDEFSTGVDAKMKRDMWITLRHVAANKAILMTTHSMEEASALANKVGIIAKRLLAVGSPEALSARYATYEVHFSCRNRADITQVQQLMAHIKGAKLVDDVATRFEVPITNSSNSDEGLSLAQLFSTLSEHDDDYHVSKATLESVFLKVIRENDIREEDAAPIKRRRWGLF